ncbi:hypothetical protein BOTBODRAFT_124058 [Botryobasidium botryosum FD-172 SS1]|uniref:Glucose-methanol-choline oxidoreductase N-terminal domain-containing protein n=1 Tax=Botryobasidium botryosum (strain FD-172 SS1) TaxID=930990 RepID=A0A067MXX8_BOTB1|nr:hypothetical protein BOTBODRAFT_124058 [Botryobasidium botryosum FD-172 SS1]
MVALNAEYDIIFAGGGTTSCLVASRLAAADPSLKILLVEAGPHTRDNPAHIQPGQFLSHLRPDSTTVKFMVGKESEHVGGRAVVVPCGQCVGGGSSVNFMMYTRAVASDFDDWEVKHGNAGWGSKDIIPLLKKIETYQVRAGEHRTHGYSGPLKVSHGKFTNVGKYFLEVGAAYDKERESTDDPNGLFSCNAYGRWQKWIDGETGRRSDVAHCIFYKQESPNLHILTGCSVKRVIFEANRAVGVEYVQNERFHPDATSEILVANAKRMVVVSAGSFGSPPILERSGIGAKSVLDKVGVKQLVDLPGVGENYQDHQTLFVPYLASEESETLDDIIRGKESEIQKWSAQWLKDGSGMMSSNALDAGIKLRPTPDELKAIGPAFQKRWETFYKDVDDKPVMWMGSVSMLVGDPTNTPARKYFSVGCYVEHPVSLGSVHIKSADDVNIPPEFDTGFLSQASDLAILKWGYKRGREFARRMACYRGEFAQNHPQFSKESAAFCRETRPVDIEAPDIQYSEEDDKVIEEYVRKFVVTAWHSLGTCAMKPREQGGVLDARLNVYGVEGLKVADLSIAPGNVAANTYSTTLGIAEKAAIIISKDLGIELTT